MSHPGATSSNFGARFLLVAVVLGFAGLPSLAAHTVPHKQPLNTVEIGELGHRVDVTLNVGDTLRIVLPANPSTGYGWQVAENSSTILQQSGSKNLSAAQLRPGAPGAQDCAFIASAPGKDRLLLDYRRPWEKNAKPAKNYVLKVTVNPSAGEHVKTPAVTPAGMQLATYRGNLPCADCRGIRTTIAFYAKGARQLTNTYFVRKMTYVGAPAGDVTSVTAGNWQPKKGTPAEPNATVYSLLSNGSGSSENYLLRGDTLVPLGSDDKPIQSPFNMNLRKQR